jgi:hypothetical protein
VPGMPELGFVLWLAFYTMLAVLSARVVWRALVSNAREVRARDRSRLPTQAEIDRECERLEAELDQLDREIAYMDATSPEDFAAGFRRPGLRGRVGTVVQWPADLALDAEAQADHAARLAAEQAERIRWFAGERSLGNEGSIREVSR